MIQQKRKKQAEDLTTSGPNKIKRVRKTGPGTAAKDAPTEGIKRKRQGAKMDPKRVPKKKSDDKEDSDDDEDNCEEDEDTCTAKKCLEPTGKNYFFVTNPFHVRIK